jgi:hypothetical protein
VEDPLVDPDDRAVLRRQGRGPGDGPLEHLARRGHLGDDAGREGLGTGEAVAGDQRPVHRRGGEGGREQGSHAGAHGEPEVDLGHAPVAAVLAHHDAVVGAARQGTGAEGVPVHRGHRDPAEAEQATPQAVEVTDHRSRLRLVGPHPVQVEAVAVEALGAGGDERQRALVSLDLVEHPVPAGHRRGVEAVLPVRHRDDGDVPLPAELDHALELGTARTTGTRPPAGSIRGEEV